MRSTVADVPPSLPLQLVPTSYESDDAWELVTALHREQSLTYGHAEDPRSVRAADFSDTNGLFLVGHVDGHPVACGGLRLLSESLGEIKRMYVRPEHRGRGYGGETLLALETIASQAGLSGLILETGVLNIGALQLYRSFGYVPTSPYVAGRDPAVNRAFAKMTEPGRPIPRSDRFAAAMHMRTARQRLGVTPGSSLSRPTPEPLAGMSTLSA